MMAFSVPPGHRREQSAARPKLDAFIGVMDAMVEEDKTRPAKQRHMAKRVWERLKEGLNIYLTNRRCFGIFKSWHTQSLS